MKMNIPYKTVLFVVAALAMGGYFYKKYFIAPKISFPNLTIYDLEGKAHQLDEFKGKPVLVNFWATWCGTCLQEMPELYDASKILKEKGIETILISDETQEKVRNYQDKSGYDFQYFTTKLDREDLKIYSIPTTYLMDKNGNVVFSKVGKERWSSPEMIKSLIDKL